MNSHIKQTHTHTFKYLYMIVHTHTHTLKDKHTHGSLKRTMLLLFSVAIVKFTFVVRYCFRNSCLFFFFSTKLLLNQCFWVDYNRFHVINFSVNKRGRKIENKFCFFLNRQILRVLIDFIKVIFILILKSTLAAFMVGSFKKNWLW